MVSVTISSAAALVAALASVVGMFLVRGTTALPAAAWGACAWAALAGEMLLRLGGGLVEPGPAACVRLAVVALALCPAMAVLGAKRPQHGVWQFIVGTLAVVLMLPIGPAEFAMPGSLPAVHVLAKWLMVVVVAIGWMNYVGTRRAAAATLVTAGQLVLMRPFLPGFSPADQIAGVIASPGIDCGAAIAAALGTVVACGQGWLAGREGGPAREKHPLAAAIDPPFLALRETLGAAWAVRIAERFDQLATSRGWPCRLTFAGLVVDDGVDDGPWRRDAWRAFAAIMRRFVSPEWLRRHAGGRTRTARDAYG
jgi:hypothetical protein